MKKNENYFKNGLLGEIWEFRLICSTEKSPVLKVLFCARIVASVLLSESFSFLSPPYILPPACLPPSHSCFSVCADCTASSFFLLCTGFCFVNKGHVMSFPVVTQSWGGGVGGVWAKRMTERQKMMTERESKKEGCEHFISKCWFYFSKLLYVQRQQHGRRVRGER